MKWTRIKDKLPPEYGDYLVASVLECDACENGILHAHRMNFVYFKFDTAAWAKKDMTLVNFYREKGDHSWDKYAEDHWCEYFGSREITHWIKIPNIREVNEKDN